MSNACHKRLELSKENKRLCTEVEKQICINQNLKEENAFMGTWSFIPGEPSPTTDVTLFTSDGWRLHAHRLILTNRSDVFRTMFAADLREKRTGEVHIDEVKGKTLKVFLHFLYTAHVSNEDMHANYVELVKISHLYQVKLLVEKMDMFLSQDKMSNETAIELLKMGITYELEKTIEAALQLIADGSDDNLFDMALEALQDNQSAATYCAKYVVLSLRDTVRIHKNRMLPHNCLQK